MISRSPDSTSSFVTASSVNPLIRTAYCAMIASNQPQRRGRPVVDPNSPPFFWILSIKAGENWVGKGPSPTRVV
ncbi:MAG: hypothetical protein A2Z83_09640 [Omnitrophica bacterium GWA2_52_8]|nr:MAG: hypothetical protein A2Z83_09640 [Omnitrophica bacterium GWA2_52_8]